MIDVTHVLRNESPCTLGAVPHGGIDIIYCILMIHTI